MAAGAAGHGHSCRTPVPETPVPGTRVSETGGSRAGLRPKGLRPKGLWWLVLFAAVAGAGNRGNPARRSRRSASRSTAASSPTPTAPPAKCCPSWAGSGRDNPSAVGDMLFAFNAGVLVLAGFLLVWHAAAGVVDTAREGRFGFGAWAIVRIVVAVALMAPLPGGMNGAQHAVVGLAHLGGDFANAVWRPLLRGGAGGEPAHRAPAARGALARRDRAHAHRRDLPAARPTRAPRRRETTRTSRSTTTRTTARRR